MSQQIVVTIRVSPYDHSEEGFAKAKYWFENTLDFPGGEITDVHCEVEDGAPRE